MDTLTHALAGTAISDGWFRKRLGPVATPFSFIVAGLPDIDSFTYLISAESAWANHRGYTHSLFPMALAAPILGYIGYRLSKKEGDWRTWTILSILCLFSHTFLDLVTGWGTMPLLPFSRMRVSWDVVQVLDIFMTPTLIAAFVLNRLLRREREETFANPLAYPVVHRHPRRRRIAMWAARVAAALIIIYLAVGWRQNRQTIRLTKQALAAQGVTPVEVRALPTMFTYISWQIAARDAEGTIYNAAHSTYAPKLPLTFTKFESLPKEELTGVLSTDDGALFAWYSQGMYVADCMPSEGGEEHIRLSDRRYWSLSSPAHSSFIMDFRKDESDGTWTVQRAAHGGLTREVIRKELDALWRLTWRGETADDHVLPDTPMPE